MIYITGDTHADFSRFTKRQRCRLPFELTEKDIVIVCGDFGLLWERNDKTLKYNLDWMSRLPFKILWVSGNHENYDMLEDYQLEEWHGGKVRHILRDQIIYLERGQVFKIEGKKFSPLAGPPATIFRAESLILMIPTMPKNGSPQTKPACPIASKESPGGNRNCPQKKKCRKAFGILRK